MFKYKFNHKGTSVAAEKMRWKLLILTTVVATTLASDHRSDEQIVLLKRYEHVNLVRSAPNGTVVRSSVVQTAYGIQDANSENSQPQPQEVRSEKIYHVSPNTVVHETKYVASSSVPSSQTLLRSNLPTNGSQKNHSEHEFVVSSQVQPKNVFRSSFQNRGSQRMAPMASEGNHAVVNHDLGTSFGCLNTPPVAPLPTANNAALLPLLGILLEFLSHTPEHDKAYLVVSLMKTFLESVPDSQEKMDVLQKLTFVENYALQREVNSRGFEEFFNFPNEDKTKIVLNTVLPGLDQEPCRETFNNLLQTSLNVYAEVSKQPECNPIGWQTLFISNKFVQPTEPITFEVVFPKEPSFIPQEVYPKLPNDFLDKVKFILEHKTAPPNNNQFVPFYPPNENFDTPPNNNPFGPVSPPNNFPYSPPFNPENNIPIVPFPLNPSNPPNNSPVRPPLPPLVVPSGPSNPPLNPFSPSNNNSPDINFPPFFPPKNPLEPVNPDYYPVIPNYYPLNPNNFPLNPNNYPLNPNNNPFSPQNPNGPPQNPTLTMDILIKLLGVISPGHDGNKSQVDPLLLPLLLKFLASLKNNPNVNNGVDKNNPKLAALLQVILEKFAHQNTLDNYPQFNTETNAYKLPTFSNNGLIELTYILKRPKPLIYQPIYYIKYRLPYQTFVQKFYELIRLKPELQYNPAKLYQELLALANVKQVSPNLNGYEKNEVMKLVFGNGKLVDAKLIKTPSDNSLSEQLELVKNLNSNVGADQLGWEVINFLNSTSSDQPVQNNFGGDVKYFEYSQNPYASTLQSQAFGPEAEGVAIGSKFTGLGSAPKEDKKTKTDDHSVNSGGYVQFSQSAPTLLGSSNNRKPLLSQAKGIKGASFNLGSSFKPVATNVSQSKHSDDEVPSNSSKEVSDLFAKLDDTKFKRFVRNE